MRNGHADEIAKLKAPDPSGKQVLYWDDSLKGFAVLVSGVSNTKTFVVQTNWPNALNRPEESVDGGGSTVAGPDGDLMFRLPAEASGLGVFNLGERQFEWHPQ